jgi:hypothetical protein
MTARTERRTQRSPWMSDAGFESGVRAVTADAAVLHERNRPYRVQQRIFLALKLALAGLVVAFLWHRHTMPIDWAEECPQMPADVAATISECKPFTSAHH